MENNTNQNVGAGNGNRSRPKRDHKQQNPQQRQQQMAQPRDMMFGITIPRTIGVSALLSAFSMVLYIAWVVAGINSKIDNSVDQIEQTKRELQQLKSEIVTRSELAIQLQSMQRDIDRVNNQTHELHSNINELDKELKTIIRETNKR
nr:MAG TPA: PilA, PilC, PilN, PilO, PilM, pilus, ring, membrane channel [Caudoviricetes sp.]